jgi:MarR family transcriptional regulator, 2-MHQ and catechol-resistance regulon repressor
MSKGEKKRRRALDAYSMLQRAATMASAQVEQAVHPFGLSASQFGVLETLQSRGPVHQQELAEALGRSKAQMTAIIDALEARGWVRRERHATDRRFISVYLTDAGRDVLGSTAPARSDAIVAIMAELSGEQRARLARLCRRLLRVLDPDQANEPADETTDQTPDDAPDETAADDDDDDDASDDALETPAVETTLPPPM